MVEEPAFVDEFIDQRLKLRGRAPDRSTNHLGRCEEEVHVRLVEVALDLPLPRFALDPGPTDPSRPESAGEPSQNVGRAGG